MGPRYRWSAEIYIVFKTGFSGEPRSRLIVAKKEAMAILADEPCRRMNFSSGAAASFWDSSLPPGRSRDGGSSRFETSTRLFCSPQLSKWMCTIRQRDDIQQHSFHKKTQQRRDISHQFFDCFSESNSFESPRGERGKQQERMLEQPSPVNGNFECAILVPHSRSMIRPRT